MADPPNLTTPPTTVAKGEQSNERAKPQSRPVSEKWPKEPPRPTPPRQIQRDPGRKTADPPNRPTAPTTVAKGEQSNETATPQSRPVSEKWPKEPHQQPTSNKKNDVAQGSQGRKPPLTGSEREAWQKEVRANKVREQEEEREASKEAARERAEEQKRKDAIVKAQTIADAEARQAERNANKAAREATSMDNKESERKRQAYIRGPIPTDIKRVMEDFLRGKFTGPECSPLTYVGYHVGLTSGLSEWERHRRLEICFRVPIPNELYKEYGHWGDPATTHRLNKMSAHIGHHASLRATQSKYAQAVSEWESDRIWLTSALGAKANGFDARWVGTK